MKYSHTLKSILLVAALLVSSLPLLAQHKRVSPHETISATVDGSEITLVYGRPYTKDPKTGEPRKIWGGLVPYGKVWRLGADEATKLTTQKALVFGSTTVPAGTYSLYLLPQEDGSAKLIINKQVGQWGTQYDEKQDLARIDLKKQALDKPVNQLTIAITSNSAGGLLTVQWESAEFSTPFTVQK